MTLDERREAFEAAAIQAAGERNRIQEDTASEIVRLPKLAESEIVARLEAQPSEYEQWALPQLRREIERVLREFGEDAGSAATAGQGTAYDAGQALIDSPLAAAGVEVSGLSPRIDRGQLLAMQSFLTGKMRDVGLDVLNRVNTELALTAIGSQGVSETIGRVQTIMGGISRRRATTIIRTELGRAFTTASQARAEEAARSVPGLKKQWRRSGKIHSRRKHDLTDGQVRPVDKPFILGTGRVVEGQESGGIRIMYPHDPAAPPSETINCGCISLPYLDSWAEAGLLENPGKKPFSEEEIALNPVKQELAEPGPTMGEILGQRTAASFEAPAFIRKAKTMAGAERAAVRRG